MARDAEGGVQGVGGGGGRGHGAGGGRAGGAHGTPVVGEAVHVRLELQQIVATTAWRKGERGGEGQGKGQDEGQGEGRS